MSSGIGRLKRHSRLPALASMASNWLPGVATNMTPLLTIGGDGCCAKAVATSIASAKALVASAAGRRYLLVVAFLQVLLRLHLLEAGPADERLRDRELSIGDLQWQGRQAARRRSADHLGLF